MCAEWTKCIHIFCPCLRISKLTYVFWSCRLSLNLVLISDTTTAAAATLATAIAPAATLATAIPTAATIASFAAAAATALAPPPFLLHPHLSHTSWSWR